MFISIYDDASPAFSIENLTELRFYVAQSSTVNVNATATAVKECFDDPFDWYQLINPSSQIFYTPVCHDNIFPDIKDFEFGLIFAVANCKVISLVFHLSTKNLNFLFCSQHLLR